MNLRSSPGFWALAMGAVGGAAGFFGPIVLNPDANQGPMLGLFVTGPGGAIAGAILGFLFRILPFGDSLRGQALTLACTALGLGTLWFALPDPAVKLPTGKSKATALGVASRRGSSDIEPAQNCADTRQ